MKNNYTIEAVAKALKVLKLFNQRRDEMTLTEISRLMDINKSSVLRIMTTLEQEGFINYQQESKKYRLGIELFRLGNVMSSTMDIKESSRKYLIKIAEETGLVVHLSILEGKDVVIIEKVIPSKYRETIPMASRVGAIVPAFCTASGKLLLSYKDNDEIRNIITADVFQKYTSHTVTNIKDLIKKIEAIRKQGYAISDREYEPFTKCFTYPVLDFDGKAIATVGVTGIVQELERIEHEKLHSILFDATMKISKELGYSGVYNNHYTREPVK